MPKEYRNPYRAESTSNRLGSYLAPYRMRIVGIILLSVVSVISALVIPVYTGEAIDFMLGVGEVQFGPIAFVATLMGLAILVGAVAQWFITQLSNSIVFGVSADLRDDCFEKLQYVPLSYLDATPKGEVTSRIIGDVEQMSQGLLLGFQQLATGVLTILFTLVLMFFLDFEVAAVVALLTPLSVLVAMLITHRCFGLFQLQSDARASMIGRAQELIWGANVVRSCSMGEGSSRIFHADNAYYEDTTFDAVFISSILFPITRFVNAIVFAGVGTFGALAAIRGTMSVGMLTAFLAYATQYSKPFNDISSIISELQNAFACAEKVFEFLDMPEIEPDAPDAILLTDAEGRLDISHVDFSYIPERQVLHDIDLHVEPGTSVALVGPTGCGKTTLVNLLMRFYDVDHGSIAVDGHDIRDISRASLRSQWGMVLQDSWIGPGSVHENIALGRPDATREQVEEAARKAHADGFIRRLPQGYDTPLGEGDMLSEGERQLLCIARVHLAAPRMLILDEATSSIDTRTELMVQKALLELMEGRTSIVVAHRLSTIRGADTICVMRDGAIVEQGTHESLLAKRGFYHQLHQAQFSGLDT